MLEELDNQLEAAYSTGNVAEYIATLKELETLVVQQNISSREQQAYFMMELYGRDLNDTEMVGLSQPLNELVLSCEWQGKPCQMSKHFYAFFNPTYGNCFTFNSGLNPNASELETVEQVGEDFGLRLMLFVNQDEYIGPIAKSAGIRVAVHEARQYSWPLNEGFFISPQAETSVAISRKLVTRLESPYSDCVYEDVGKYSYLTYFPEYSYSMTGDALPALGDACSLASCCL
ncbi:PREDICTED: degenerin mec-10-like isoform X2 [Priapulus caudatus]|uniref:Degenerin mec-10-like isoform X2 n=1 Tax=Priapulus caudatus TaxID=37621 RepID=A0ABM1EJ62_PRICU|nr:PREDICTED: degenerin mec-10-like isoform X2 [Priapulus caudatus]